MKKILIAGKDEQTAETIKKFSSKEYKVEEIYDPELVHPLFKKKRHDVVFIDTAFLTSETEQTESIYRHQFKSFFDLFPVVQIIVMSSQDDMRNLVSAVKAGAANYLTYPAHTSDIEMVMKTVEKNIQMKSELDYLRDRFWRSEWLQVLHTNNEKMKRIFDKIKSVAQTKATVLLTGETGTGKGIMAQLIHLHSNRSNKPFIHVHCGAIPDTLIESELFGHERGAFTGAVRKKLGKFEIAKGGAVFLDEIASITPAVQVKLLQVLQEKIFYRVGGESPLQTDVRIIAATNENLVELVEKNTFRKDLYYRLNIFPIEIPPLRERKEDIPILLNGYLEQLNKIYSKNIYEAHPIVISALTEYDWPGNIREFENILERAYILEKSNTLNPQNLPAELSSAGSKIKFTPVDTSKPLNEIRKKAVEEAEQHYLKELLTIHAGRIDATAQAAGITARRLHKLLTKYDIKKEIYKIKKNAGK